MENVASLKAFLSQQLPTALDLLHQMVDINSFTANKDGVNRLGRLTADIFKPLGFVSEFVPSTNSSWGDHLVLSRRGNGPKNIALISHLDTVFPPEEERQNNFRWRPEGDLIFGPGTHDIKGGTAMIWLVLSGLQQWAPKYFDAISWKIFCNSAEECFSNDFGEICRKRFDPNTLAALVFEAESRAGNDLLLAVARKGRGTWRITVMGRGAHAGGKHAHGANAIVQLGQILPQVAALTDYSRELTVNVATVSGGTVLNRVPHVAVAEGEFRAFASANYAHAKSALLGLGGPGNVKSAADNYPCEIEVEILDEIRPWIRNEGTERLFALWRDTGKELGIGVLAEERGGLSDGNLLWDAVPTLDGLGPWGDNDHCSEYSADGKKLPEFVQVSSFVPKALLNCAALTKIAKA